MKQLRNQMVAVIKERFNRVESMKETEIDTMVAVEIMLNGCILIDSSMKMYDAWSILAGHDEVVLPPKADLSIVRRLRVLVPEFRYENYWIEELESYFRIEGTYRLFEKSEEGKIKKIKPVIFPERDSHYHALLTKPLEKVANSQSFLGDEPFRYVRMEEGVRKEFRGNIPPSILNGTHRNLPLYKKKVRFEMDPSKWKNIGFEMDQKTNGQKNYQKRAGALKLKSTAPNKQAFKYEDIQHIVGGLSAGKSTMMMVETYRIVKEKGGKVGFIEGSVPQVIERVKELRALGINAVPIIGKSNREKYETDFIISRSKSIHDIADIASEDFSPLSFISDRCTIKAIVQDDKRINYYPCTNLKTKNGKKKKCPLAHSCGVYKELSQLADADVWVATPASVLKTRLPAMIDPYERTIYEAMYDLLDVVFVDEADIVQKNFDEAFIRELTAFGQKNHFFEREFEKANLITNGQYEKYASDKLVSQWVYTLGQLRTVIWKLYDKINHSKSIRSHLRNKIIWTSALLYEISGKLSGDDNQYLRKKVQKRLWEYVKKPFYSNNPIAELADKLQEVDDYMEKQKNISEVIRITGGKCKPRIKKKLLYDQIELLLYLARLDSGIKFLLSYYSQVQNRLGAGYEDDSFEMSVASEFQALLPDAMTGFMLGYRYHSNENNHVGSFKLIEYSGIGRYLLAEWHHIFEDLYGVKGPAIVLLSGTSHLPESPHYHLEIEPQWIIKAERKRSKVTQIYLPKYDEANDCDIAVSGTVDCRYENLKKLTNSLIEDIQWELNYWKKKNEKRGVILVVNSYEDVDHAGEVFRNDPKWEGRYRLLSRNSLDYHHDIWYPRSFIEEFSETGAEVLIAPLLAVGRGYNILNEQNEAYFGSAFFLVRPYPVPNDATFLIQSLHAKLGSYYEKIEKNNLKYGKALKKLHRLSRSYFEKMYEKPDFWSILTDAEKVILSWYMFVPVWQMIGRLLRGGKDANIFYCDAKFYSLLEYWKELMKKHKDELVFQELYSPFMKSINDI